LSAGYMGKNLGFVITMKGRSWFSKPKGLDEYVDATGLNVPSGYEPEYDAVDLRLVMAF